MKRMLRIGGLALATATLAATAWAGKGHHGPGKPPARDLGTEVLGPGDGWAAFGPGTTGGANASADQIYVVSNRRELIAALNDGRVSSTSPANASAAPKIIYVQGVIDANVDDANNPLSCDDYAAGTGYSLEAYLATYDPDTWGRTARPSGPLEDARLVARNRQQARVRIRPGSNTTIVGLGREATIRGAWFDLRGNSATDRRSNIIIRNLTFEDTFDCFPAWDPLDGAQGNWNAQYDAISLREVENVWIDHNTFRNVTTPNDSLPTYFGRKFEVHDGQVDITNGSDLVTVSWNRFEGHDKLMLIGSSDGATGDRGRLRVTLHHNLFDDAGQRAPRVRFGQVHIYNNYYRIRNPDNYAYSWGVGIESQIHAEENFFFSLRQITPDRFIARFNGTALTAINNLHTGAPARRPLDVIGAWNTVNSFQLGRDAGWTPTLDAGLQPAWTVPQTVLSNAGPMAW